MEPKIVTRERQYAVGFADSFPEDSFHAISKLWDQFIARKGEIKNVRQGYALGICASTHPTIKKQPGHSFVYMAALPVESAESIPEGMVAWALPESKYAVFTHKGPLNRLPETVSYIWGTWLPSGKYKFAETPDFEVYDERFDPHSPDSELDIYVPII